MASLEGAATSRIILGANDLTIGFGNALNTNGTADAEFGGVISGSGGLLKDDESNQILSGANTYEGVTTVSGGVLTAASAGALGGGVASAGIRPLKAP